MEAKDGELIARFTAFMMRIVKSARVDYIRKQRHWKRETPMDKPPLDESSPVAERWQSGISDNEFHFEEDRISDAISSFPALRRRILELAFIEKLTAQEIADMLGCPIKFVYNQKHAALKKLRDTLLKGGDQDA